MSELTLDDYILNLRSPNSDVRRNAAWMLGRSRDLQVIDPLIAALNDPDASVRLRVAESLGNQRDRSIVQPLTAAMQTETEPEVRASMALSLGRQGDSHASLPLFAALQDASPAVRSASAEALGLLIDPRSVEPLVRVLLNDEDEDTRYQAGRALSQIGGENVSLVLINALHTDLLNERKVQIIEILAQIHAVSAVETLKTLADELDEALAETAKWALRQLGVG